jgi:hypothetical protein
MGMLLLRFFRFAGCRYQTALLREAMHGKRDVWPRLFRHLKMN